MTISRRHALLGIASTSIAAALSGCGGGGSGAVPPAHSETVYDLIVVGAGISGISAARTALSYGAKVLVLEAQNYIGGRVLTDATTFSEIGFDLGAQFFQAVDRGNELYDIAQREGLQLLAAAGDNPPADSLFTQVMNGSQAAGASDQFALGVVAAAIKSAIANGGSAIAAGLAADGPVSDVLTPAIQSLQWYESALDQAVIEICGGTNRSLYDLYQFQQLEPLPFAVPGVDYILKSGMGTFAQSLAKSVPVLTGFAVTSIATGNTNVQVTANGRMFSAKTVIVTAPTNVLAKSNTAGGITFDPPLPATYVSAFAALPLAPVYKALLGFKPSFEFNVPGVTPANAFSVVLPLSNTGISTYFPNFWNTNTCEFIASGDLAVQLDGAGKGAASALLDEIDQTFPGAKAAWDGRITGSSWISNPYFGGAYSAAMPGQFQARATIAEPIGNQLWFAGEAVNASGARGLMQGAWRSGAAAQRPQPRRSSASASLGACVRTSRSQENFGIWKMTMNDERLRQEASVLSPDDICAEILALSVVEYTYTPSLSITAELGQSGGRIHDSGRGIMLTPDPGDTMSHAERSHTCIYPCFSAKPTVDSILQELVWGKRGALGPALPTAACPLYQFVSERDGEKWSQSFRYGTPLGPAKMLGQTSASGTTVTFNTGGRIDHAAFARLTERLCSRIPGLVIAFRATP